LDLLLTASKCSNASGLESQYAPTADVSVVTASDPDPEVLNRMSPTRTVFVSVRGLEHEFRDGAAAIVEAASETPILR
jgi:hypothetical protein